MAYDPAAPADTARVTYDPRKRVILPWGELNNVHRSTATLLHETGVEGGDQTIRLKRIGLNLFSYESHSKNVTSARYEKIEVEDGPLTFQVGDIVRLNYFRYLECVADRGRDGLELIFGRVQEPRDER